MLTTEVTRDEYGRVFNIIERAAHPDMPPTTPDPNVAHATWEVFRALGRVGPGAVDRDSSRSAEPK
jgi:hypothetical protein